LVCNLSVNQNKNERRKHMREIPSPGTYAGEISGTPVVHIASTGSLCLTIPIRLKESQIPWSGRHTFTLINKTGEPMTKTVDNLKDVFGWDGQDPYWFSEADLKDVAFDIVGEHETYTPKTPTDENPDCNDTTVFNSKWINKPGASGVKMPEMADRKEIMAKFGAKFRAMAGVKSTPAKKAEPAKAAAPTPAKASAPAPKKPAPKSADASAPSCTMDDAYSAIYTALNAAGKTEDEINEAWYARMEELFPAKAGETYSLQNWATIRDSFVAA
jgi:hypothetical protein